jgi:hypothetical protein
MYKPLPYQIMAEQKNNEDSDAAVLMACHVTLKTLSPNQETKGKKMVLDGGGIGNIVCMTILASEGNNLLQFGT